MYCKKCGKELDQDDKFCQFCGEKVEENQGFANNINNLTESNYESRNPEVEQKHLDESQLFAIKEIKIKRMKLLKIIALLVCIALVVLIITVKVNDVKNYQKATQTGQESNASDTNSNPEDLLVDGNSGLTINIKTLAIVAYDSTKSKDVVIP